MALLLNWRIWALFALLAAFAATNFTSYRKGQHVVKQEWLAATAAANSEARSLEQQRQRRADEAGQLAAARENLIRTDASHARAESDGLRGSVESAQRRGQESQSAANDAIRTLGDVLQSCGAEYQRVAEEADRAYSEVKTLRDAWPK